MEEYIKLFQNHTQYETYKNSADYVIPNVSYCEQQDEVHYDPETRIIAKFNITSIGSDNLYLYFDDFPVNKCEDEYDGDMEAFKQDAIDFINSTNPEESPEALNEYKYTGETYEYDNEEYYLWESTNEDQTYLKYLLTDRLDFTGLSLEDDIDADYCPFIYILNEDSEVIYDNEYASDYYLVAIKEELTKTNIMNPDNKSYFSKIEIDGVTQSSVESSYAFSTLGEHTVKYTLVNPSEISRRAFYFCSDLISVTIPNSVTIIRNGAFNHCENLTTVSIPNSVISIEDYAFYVCSNLTSVTIPNSVISIGNDAFSVCSGLTSVTIGNSVTSIGSQAFYGCTRLTSVTIPNSVTTIGNSAFCDCHNLTSVTIGNSVTTIGNRAFRQCSVLTSVIIPNSVTSIGDYAFYNCSRLTSVTIGNSVTSIGEEAFYNCSGLQKVIVNDIAAWCNISFSNFNANPLYYAHHLYSDENTEITDLVIPNSITSIKTYAFNGCSGLTSVDISNSVTIIRDYAFQNCSGLTSVTIPNSVNTIKSYAFQHCSGLTSVIIGNSVTRIEIGAFITCINLTSVIIGNSVTNIGQNTFSDCRGLASIICNATIAPTISSYTFQNIKTGGTLTVPVGSTGYDVWMGTGNYYLGKYNWTKVEQ